MATAVAWVTQVWINWDEDEWNEAIQRDVKSFSRGLKLSDYETWMERISSLFNYLAQPVQTRQPLERFKI